MVSPPPRVGVGQVVINVWGFFRVYICSHRGFGIVMLQGSQGRGAQERFPRYLTPMNPPSLENPMILIIIILIILIIRIILIIIRILIIIMITIIILLLIIIVIRISEHEAPPLRGGGEGVCLPVEHCGSA